jgi:predicted AAA+ superfamily ATPase
MLARHLSALAFSTQWGRQMRLIMGPRQVGKTTIAKHQLSVTHSDSLYFLWDRREVRKRYKENELFFTEEALKVRGTPWICFDEIHKMTGWKNILKAIYDETGDRFHFIVTGSAKLSTLRRSGDSLAGRYSAFHLFPLTLAEAANSVRAIEVPTSASTFLQQRAESAPASQESLAHLLQYGGFPEPYVRASRAFHTKWARDYADAVIREDIGLLTRIVDREHLVDLYELLPGTIGSPVSVASLSNHLQISPVSARNYLQRMQDFYLIFPVRPYTKNIKRSLLKAAKYYLFDWTRIENAGARFENYVACELLTHLHWWSDFSGERLELRYVRTKEKRETDFLIVRNNKPFLLVEAKLADTPIEQHHLETMTALGATPFVQVCQVPGVLTLQKRDAYRMSATRLFGTKG